MAASALGQYSHHRRQYLHETILCVHRRVPLRDAVLPYIVCTYHCRYSKARVERLERKSSHHH